MSLDHVLEHCFHHDFPVELSQQARVSQMISVIFLRPNFLQNEVGVKISNFFFASSVAKSIPMNMHVGVSTYKGKTFICQMQTAGEILLVDFCWQSFAGEVSGKISE